MNGAPAVQSQTPYEDPCCMRIYLFNSLKINYVSQDLLFYFLMTLGNYIFINCW